jgi:hypothetical protein
MRSMSLLTMTAAGLLVVAPAFAQHGNGNMNAMGGGMGHSNISGRHGSNSPADNQTGPKSPGDLVAKNSQLSSKLQGLLPKGVTPEEACTGFKNLGQCVAAIHVSHNLGISFDCMKADMTGQAPPTGSSCPTGTGSKTMSMAKSIQTLRPTADSKSEVKKANEQAEDDLKQSGA